MKRIILKGIVWIYALQLASALPFVIFLTDGSGVPKLELGICLSFASLLVPSCAFAYGIRPRIRWAWWLYFTAALSVTTHTLILFAAYENAPGQNLDSYDPDRVVWTIVFMLPLAAMSLLFLITTLRPSGARRPLTSLPGSADTPPSPTAPPVDSLMDMAEGARPNDARLAPSTTSATSIKLLVHYFMVVVGVQLVPFALFFLVPRSPVTGVIAMISPVVFMAFHWGAVRAVRRPWRYVHAVLGSLLILASYLQGTILCFLSMFGG